MKFIRKDNSVITLEDKFSLVSKETSPIKEIINRRDLSEFYFVSDKTISFKELIQIQVNVIDVGVMIFVFETASFNKDKFIEDVSKLKENKLNKNGELILWDYTNTVIYTNKKILYHMNIS